MDWVTAAPRKALGGYQSMTKKSLQNSIRVRPKELEEFIAARLKRRPYRRKETAQSARGWRRRRVSRDGVAAVPIGGFLQRTAPARVSPTPPPRPGLRRLPEIARSATIRLRPTR